ncbi:efflux RND transporter periplasmic adaptor subunit [Novosphingobium panipatense]|uniref:biotin/lipoyl-binding protein n=1 Tax=Novosphingobium panipatense TaxID=428991 RepID=UPI00360B8BAD
MIQPPANARVAVAATFPGVVMRTLVVEGDTVRQGQPLAVISSRDVLTMGADLTRANARAGVARSNAARLSQLAREGIIAGARADEAHALAAEAGADVAEKARILKMVNGEGGAAPIR